MGYSYKPSVPVQTDIYQLERLYLLKSSVISPKYTINWEMNIEIHKPIGSFYFRSPTKVHV